MPPALMHDGQVAVDAGLVRRLLDDQLPRLAALPVREVASEGTENAIFRLGDDLAVRLPLHEAAVPNLRKEARWLPVVTADLTLDVPALVATGSPSDGYPFPWTVLGWVDGAPAAVGDADALPDTGSVLGRLVTELRAVDTAGAPAQGTDGFGRGGPLAERDRAFREAEPVNLSETRS